MNVIVTGGTKGIGRAIVELFTSNGGHIIFCARSKKDIHKLEQDMRKLYPTREIHGYVCDVSIKSQVEDFGKFVIQQFDTIDVLVNNAGVFKPGEILQEDDGVLAEMMDTNLMSAYNLTRVLAPRMKNQGNGHIFNMCSVASLQAYPNGGSYCISKFALLGFSKVLREELKTHGVKVTSILPGATWSDSWAGASFDTDRLMTATDIALTIWNAYSLSNTAVVEEVVIRPQLGDL